MIIAVLRHRRLQIVGHGDGKCAAALSAFHHRKNVGSLARLRNADDKRIFEAELAVIRGYDRRKSKACRDTDICAYKIGSVDGGMVGSAPCGKIDHFYVALLDIRNKVFDRNLVRALE